MDILTILRSGGSPQATYAPFDQFWYQKAPYKTSSGLAVSPEQALRLSAVWACVGIRSEAMASLPVILYRRLDAGGKERATDKPLYKRLRWQPNPWQTAFEFEEMAEAHVCLRGNFYARIVQSQFGEITALIPLHPDRMAAELLPSGMVRYTYRNPDGRTEILMQTEVHHRRGRSLDGVNGLSPTSYGRDVLGLAMAGEAFASDHYTGGAAPPFALKHPLTLGPDGIRNLKTSLSEYKSGDKFLILEENMDAMSLGVSARDAQILESRQYGIPEIARIWNVPLHFLKVNTAGSVSYASVEMFDLEFVTHTIRPEAIRNEQTMWRDLLSEKEQDEYVFEYLLDALMRGDSAGRAAFYKSLAEVESITPNEIRERENMNPLPGGNQVVKNVPASPPTPVEDPRTPTGKPRGEADVRARWIAMEACSRVVQKEIAAATKAALKFADDPKGWKAWGREFYGDHAGFVAHVLKLPTNYAKTYAEQQRAQLERQGMPACQDWDTRVVAELAALALGEENS